MAKREPGPGAQHPEEDREDLNPEARAGENTAEAAPSADSLQTLADIQEARDKLKGFPREALRQVPVVPEGERLQQGATYIDLRTREPHEFKARANMLATREHWYVPKADTAYELWNGLTGVSDPERLNAPRRESA